MKEIFVFGILGNNLQFDFGLGLRRQMILVPSGLTWIDSEAQNWSSEENRNLGLQSENKS